MKDEDMHADIQDLETEKIVEDLSKACKSIKRLEQSVSHRRIELTIEQKLQEEAKNKSENTPKY